MEATLSASLFKQIPTRDLKGTPLAERLRPQSFEEIWGQASAIGPRSVYGRLIQADRIPNTIIWGPPGSGKTTFARLLASKSQSQFLALSAITSGAKDLREVGERASEQRRSYGTKTLVFVDEIHRLNKSQQDVLLPFIEAGEFTLVGATTENPSYELNRALLSRSHLLVFSRLDDTALNGLLVEALGKLNIPREQLLTEDAHKALVSFADGDARRLLNAIEILSLFFDQESSQNETHPDAFAFPLTAEAVAKALGQRPIHYDKDSDQHYDVISAFIKSIRGSDPQAAVYYLARMIKGGEDPVFIARRLVILASEDIGNADPRGLSLAVAALQATELIGLPEARISLAQCALYLACAPKSNSSYVAIDAALAEVEKSGTLPVPLKLRSAKTDAMKKIGYGKDYKYPHSEPRGFSQQRYLPDSIHDANFFEASTHGFEKNMQAYLDWLRGPTPKT
jgi:putative ATPase